MALAAGSPQGALGVLQIRASPRQRQASNLAQARFFTQILLLGPSLDPGPTRACVGWQMA